MNTSTTTTSANGAAILPDGRQCTRTEAMLALQRKKIACYLTRPSGQISTLAGELGVPVRQQRLGDGMVRVTLGIPRRRVPTGLESPTASAVGMLTPRERSELKRLLGKLIAAL